ncbi:MAG: hypothetical protein AB8H79_22575 [Myxococcota bacterium]
MQLTAHLVTRDGSMTEGLPSDSDEGSIALAIPWDFAPDLREAQELDLMLDASVGAVRAEVIVQQLRPEDDALEVRLAYADPDRIRVRMPGAVREALRLASGLYGRPARLNARVGPVGWTGTLVDLDPNTATLCVAREHAPKSGVVVPLQLHLPEKPQAIPLSGRVELSFERGRNTWVTLRFVGETDRLSRVGETIHGWLLSRRSGSMSVAV